MGWQFGMAQNEIKHSVSEAEQLSAWLDDDNQMSAELAAALKDPSMRKRYESYHAISAALNNDSCQHWQAGFSDQVAASIADEPSIFAPNNIQSRQRTLAGWAVAASVALAVVFGSQLLPVQQTVISPVVADSSGGQANMLAEYHVTDDERAELDKINQIFSQYSQQTQANNNSSLPYVRLVSGEQVKTFRMTPQQFRQVMMALEQRNKEAEQKAIEEITKGKTQ
ncbi:MAG: sigma-E factor negative regulatory protein [Kangiellaceae bacterium]|jgi:negative regulator of sigma E activity|nr:sigma-E factor negative regulatory protein [Kangiellaceae bacterium]